MSELGFFWTIFRLGKFLIENGDWQHFLIENGDLPKSSLCFPVHIGVSIKLCLGQSQVKTLKMESARKKTYYGVGFVPPVGAES